MLVNRLTTYSFRALVMAALLSSSSLLSILPAVADEKSAPAGVDIKNQATAAFTDDADATTQTIVSNTVKVSVLEIAGIAATGGGEGGNAYRTGTAYAEFIVSNQGNDPTKFFIPGTPSKIQIKNAGGAVQTYNATLDGSLTVVEYSASPYGAGTPTAIDKDNIVPATGGVLGSLTSTTAGTTALPDGGSIPAGGYVRVRVPIKVPFEAVATDVITVTLGNTIGTNTTNVVYAADGDNGTGNDLYTKDNANNTLGSTITNEADGVPYNGDGTPGDTSTTTHRQEASATQTITVVNKFVKITGTVFNDINKDGTKATSGELGTNGVFGTNKTKINVILVDTDSNTVLASKELLAADNGYYEFLNIQTATNYKVYLSETKYTSGTAPAVSIVGTKWVGTTPVTTASTAISKSGTVALVDIIADLGIRQKAKLVLVKRITGIAKTSTDPAATLQTTNPYKTGYNFAAYKNDTTVGAVGVENDNPNNDATNPMNWPDNYIKGEFDAGPVAPGDTIEYTVYFLNNEGGDAKNVKLCDPIRGEQTFVSGSLSGVIAGTSTTLSGADYAVNAAPTNCNATAVVDGKDNGGVAIDNIPAIVGATTAATGTTATDGSYGYFKFKTKVTK